MAGLGTLIKLILRRDRIKLPVWIVGFVLLLIAMVPLLQDIYGDEQGLQAIYSTLGSNPAGIFMTGPMDSPTFGALVTIETLLWWGMAVAFLNTLLIVRHTRHNEEIGAQELLLYGQLHRSSSLVAALVVALGVNIVIALGTGIGFELVDSAWGASQSWLFAIAVGVFGLVWAAIASVVVQFVESGRSANGIAAALIGGAFVVRGIGDFMGSQDAAGVHHAAWVSYLSPFGWLQAARPLTTAEWGALVLPICFIVVASAVGFFLLAHRDVGAGLLPSRRGKARASRFLQTPLGLTIYLQKNIYIGWLVAVLVMVGTIGTLVPQMTGIYDSSESMRQLIMSIGGAGALLPSFMSAMIAIVCLMVFAYAIHSLSKLRSEETSGHLESILATRVSRLRWLWLHAIVIAIGGVSMLVLTGLVLALCITFLSDFDADITTYIGASLSYVPVLLLFIALYLLLFGTVPQIASGVVWCYFGFVSFLLWIGPIVELGKEIMNISVMEHLATPPLEDIAWQPLAVIILLAIALCIAGVVLFRRRNLTV